ncbi:MAG TPA: TonB family protein [Sphingomicrobium sp.]|nr:TonB family protein [Sphingomicrobium sp.]
MIDKTQPPATDEPSRQVIRIRGSTGALLILAGARSHDWGSFEWTSLKLNGEQIEALLTSRTIEVAVGSQPSVSVELDGSSALPKLHGCWAMQMTQYGINPALAESVSRWPEPNPPLTSLFTSDDYPLDAMHAGAEGVVGIKIEVDEQGHKLGCNVVKSNGNVSLDTKTCAIAMTRGTFKPAIDKAGGLVKAPYVTGVSWRLTQQ